MKAGSPTGDEERLHEVIAALDLNRRVRIGGVLDARSSAVEGR